MYVGSEVYGKIADNCESGMKELLGSVEGDQDDSTDRV